MGKDSGGPFNVTQGGTWDVSGPTGPASTARGTSGATEPAWPQSLGATVVDGSAAITGSVGIAGEGSGSGVGTALGDGGVGIGIVGGDGGGGGGGGGLISVGGVGLASGNGITWTAIYARRTNGVVTGLLTPQVFQHNKFVYPAHYFQYGYLLWTGGANAGRRIDIRDSMGVQSQAGKPDTRPYIFLYEICPNPIAIGDTFTAVIGCNKSRTMCQYFNNFANFRGFPDMPTEERALQTPNLMSQGYAPKQTK